MDGKLGIIGWWIKPGMHEPPVYASDHYHTLEVPVDPARERLHKAFHEAFDAWKELGMEGVLVVRVEDEQDETQS